MLNRLLKNILKTSTDDDLVAEKMIETENEHYDFDKSNVVNETKKEVESNTASEELTLEEMKNVDALCEDPEGIEEPEFP